MKWRRWWILGAVLAVTGCEDKGGSGQGDTSSAATAQPTLPKLTDKLPSSVSADRPVAKTDEDPKAEFKTFKELYKEQDDAIGKTILFRGYGTPLKPGFSHLSECKPSTERANILEATFQEGQRDVMRGMPSNQYVQQGKCPRLHIKITGFNKKHRYPQGEVVDIYDVEPDPPPKKLPDGVDFISMDDLFLAGPAAVGKVADFGVYPGQQDGSDDSWGLVATGCSPHGGWMAQLSVHETDDNRAFLQGLRKAGQSTCARVRAKITKAPKDNLTPRWGAELLAVGPEYPKPHPAPNP